MSGKLKGNLVKVLGDVVGIPVQRKTDTYVYFWLRTGFDRSIPDSGGNCSPTRAKKTLEMNELRIDRFKHDEDSLAIKIKRRERERAEILFDQMKTVVKNLDAKQIAEDDFINFGSLDTEEAADRNDEPEEEVLPDANDIRGQAILALTNQGICVAVWGRESPGKKWTLEQIRDLFWERLPQLEIAVIEQPEIKNNIVRFTIRTTDESKLRLYLDKSPNCRHLGYDVSSM